MSQTYTHVYRPVSSQMPAQEQFYQVAQPRAPRLPPPAQPLPRAPMFDDGPIVNPLLLAGQASARANVELNQQIREEAKQRAEEVFAPVYNRAQAPGGEPPEPPGGEPNQPLEEDKNEGDDENQPLLGQVNQIMQAQPPPPGVNMERYRDFLANAVRVGNQVGEGTKVVTNLSTQGVLMYHLWSERQFNGKTGHSGVDDKAPETSDAGSVQKKIEDKIKDPVPPQCFRHVYKDERGQLRTVVICKTEGHGQRFYHDA